MLKRKIYDDLIAWKSKENKMCLLVEGARQVGKTYIIDEFAKNNYENYIYINFIENENYITIFDGDLDVDTLIKQISLRVPSVEIVPNKTIIFLDEIQKCPRARTALKFFSIDKRFDVIASGSLLGINYKEVPSFPVGYVEHLEMSSLDFEEFCWANGVSENSIQDIHQYFISKKTVPLAMHEKMLELFREYIVVGGMPNVVNDFVTNHNFASVLQMQRAIIKDYKDDISLYAETNEKTKIKEVFLSIPKHLASDYKKFKYSAVEKGGSSRKYAGCLMWLYDAGIISFCYNLSKPELPFEGNVKEDNFKVYMKDNGLLMAMLEDGSQQDIIDGNLGIYKGAIYENIIADIFTKLNKKLYYFEYNNRLEIDFFIRYNGKPVPIEVKGGDNTKSKSLHSVIDNWGIEYGIRLSTKNLGHTKQIDSFPIYMAMFL